MKTSSFVAAATFSAALCLALALPAAAEPPLGEWSSACSPAFRIAAMPSAWTVNPAQTPLTVTARLAVDFELLPSADWELEPGDRGDDPSARLTGFRDLLLEARVVAAGGAVPLARLDARATTDDAHAVTFSWDGRDDAGKLVAPGTYQIEVRARVIPVRLGVDPRGLRYRDLDGFGDVAEACSRPLHVEVSDQLQEPRDLRGTTCADPPGSYYASVDATNATTLRATLHNVIDDHTRFPYSSSSTDTWDVIDDADENPSNAAQLIDIYKNQTYADGCSGSCSYDREHSWPSSFGFTNESGPGRIPHTDCHHLRASYPSYNGTRGNKPFNDCTSGCTAYPTDVNNGVGGSGHDNLSSGSSITCPGPPDASDLWEVWDHRRGDSARSMFYMDLRYNGDSGALGDEPELILTDNLSEMACSTSTNLSPAYFGVLSTLVEWSLADPPDADELRRNGQVWCYQQNRNPFVDHPEWVACLYLNQCGAFSFSGIGSATDLAPCAATGVALSWSTPSDWNDGCSSSCSRGFRVFRNGVEITSGGCDGPLAEAATSCTDTTGSTGVTYAYSVEAFNHLADTTGGTTTLNAADATSDAIAPLISGVTATPAQTTFTVDWSTDEAADSELEWGTSTGVYPFSTSSASLVTSHSLDATGLSASTPYFYRVCSTDACGAGPACSSEGTVTTSGAPPAAAAWVNELHYDNASTDADEGVEIAGPAGLDLTGWSLAVYNGNGGGLSTSVSPNPAPLSGVLADAGNGLGFKWFAIANIENGAPDGVALVDDAASVVQFLCYEGTFTATAGAANGMLCTDIGVAESGTTLVTDSLQLTGGPGCAYADFSWTGPTASSHDAANAGQSVVCTVPAIFADGFESGGTSAWSLTLP